MTRQSEQRRLMYCQSSSVNSGCEFTASNTVVSGFSPSITRSYVAADTRVSARVRKSRTHCSNPPRASALLASRKLPPSAMKLRRLGKRRSFLFMFRILTTRALDAENGGLVKTSGAQAGDHGGPAAGISSSAPAPRAREGGADARARGGGDRRSP